MVKTTLLARVADGLALAASYDDEEPEDLNEYKQQAKILFKRLSQTTEQRCSLDTGPYVYHYLIEFGVCYLCLTEKSYPKKLAFAYLEELQRSFHEQYGREVDTVARPYAFRKFDSDIARFKKQYKDTRTARNLNKLNDDLQDVHRIMTKNIQDVLGRGESLDRMSTVSKELSDKSKTYLKQAKKLNLQALYQKYGPPIIVLTVVIFVFYIRFWWW